VELHAGSIRAVSDGRDQGTTVLIKLPLVVDAPVTDKKSTPTESPAAAPVKASGGRRVLLVEDHRPTSLAMKSLLGRRGHTVTVAGNLAEARTAIAAHDFELLICDIGLPDGDGCELMGELRDRRGMVGLALTGYGMEQDVNRSRDAGFVAHLTKPVSMGALERALAGACQHLDAR